MSTKEMADKLVFMVDHLPQHAMWNMTLIHEIMAAAIEIGRHLKAGTTPDEKRLFGGEIARYMEVTGCRIHASISGSITER